MTDELRAGAEQIVECDAILESMPDGAIERHALNIARDYIRRTDPTPIDEKWCRELLGTNKVGRIYEGGTWIPEIRGIDQWVRLRPGTTRGQLLSLLECLGWKKGVS